MDPTSAEVKRAAEGVENIRVKRFLSLMAEEISFLEDGVESNAANVLPALRNYLDADPEKKEDAWSELWHKALWTATDGMAFFGSCSSDEESNMANLILDVLITESEEKAKEEEEIPRKRARVDMSDASDASKVMDFTLAAGETVPEKPQSMSRSEVEFLVKMAIDEYLELLSTVEGPDDAKAFLRATVGAAKVLPHVSYESDIDKIADQADALVDVYYYGLNAAAKKRVDLSAVFDIVHQANLTKRGPDGLFRRREDGKILKPEGWVPPDIRAEIARQFE